jgi:hypothetical protein
VRVQNKWHFILLVSVFSLTLHQYILTVLKERFLYEQKAETCGDNAMLVASCDGSARGG